MASTSHDHPPQVPQTEPTTNPSNPSPISLSPPEANPLLTTFTHFLTLAIHSLLFHRALYPPTTFLAVRALNIPVHQSRHPGVCAWINDAVAAVGVQLRRGAVERIAFAVHAPDTKEQQQEAQQQKQEQEDQMEGKEGDEAEQQEPRRKVLERWVFDVASFPTWAHPRASSSEKFTDEQPIYGGNGTANANGGAGGGGLGEADGDDGVNWTDVYESLRGALRRIAYAAETMPAPPEGSTFTLAVELRDDAEAPIGHPQPWIPSEPDMQPPSKHPSVPSPNTQQQHPSRRPQGSSLGGTSTKPIRSVQAGPLFFECWVEQAKPLTKRTQSRADSQTSQTHTTGGSSKTTGIATSASASSSGKPSALS